MTSSARWFSRPYEVMRLCLVAGSPSRWQAGLTYIRALNESVILGERSPVCTPDRCSLLAAHRGSHIAAISLAFRYAPTSAVESEVACLLLKAETLVPVGRSEIWKISCREKLTTSEEDPLSHLVGSGASAFRRCLRAVGVDRTQEACGHGDGADRALPVRLRAAEVVGMIRRCYGRRRSQTGRRADRPRGTCEVDGCRNGTFVP
jgi:hypothetical protein